MCLTRETKKKAMREYPAKRYLGPERQLVGTTVFVFAIPGITGVRTGRR